MNYEIDIASTCIINNSKHVGKISGFGNIFYMLQYTSRIYSLKLFKIVNETHKCFLNGNKFIVSEEKLLIVLSEVCENLVQTNVLS